MAAGDAIVQAKLCSAAGLVALLVAGCCAGSRAEAADLFGVEPSLNGTVPVEVVLPPGPASPVDVRPWFDDFSWRSFVALNWPVVPDHPGVPATPDQPKTLIDAPAGYVSVWDSYRDASDLFRPDAQPPIPFSDPQQSPTLCGTPSAGNKVLQMQGEQGTVLGDVEQAFSFPLVDQNKNYVYYEIRYNSDQYEFVRTNELYLAKRLMQAEMKAPIAMPISAAQPYRQGAVMVKAAWKQLTDRDDASRYYTTQGTIIDVSTGQPVCRAAKLGLIGFHIGHKVDKFAQWIWSTFEQVDNVPPDHGSPARAMSLNNGTDAPMTQGGWANRPDGKRQVQSDRRVPAQVTRLNPIPTTPQFHSTVDVNDAYRAALAGTVWSNYQLVVTQWPTQAVAQADFVPPEQQGVYPKDAGQPFPETGAVNTAVESFFQSAADAKGAGGNSCMQCHYGAGNADFSWSLKLRAK